MRVINCVIFCFLSLSLYANSSNDSLLKIIFNTKLQAEQRVKAIYGVYQSYEHVKPDTCLIFSDLLEELNTKKQDTIFADAEIMRANAFYDLAKFDSSKIYLESALIKEKNYNRYNKQALIFNGLSVIAERHSDHENSIKYATTALRLLQKTGDQLSIAQAMFSIGNIHRKLNDNEKALPFFKDALQITIKLDDKFGQAKCYGNIGNCYNFLKKYNEAMEALNNSLAIYTEINDKRGIGTTYGNIGLVYLAKKEYQSALKQFRKAIDIAEKINDLNQLSYHYARMSKSFQHLSMKDSALFYAQKSIDVNNFLKNPTGVMNTYRILKDVYSDSKDYKNAYFTLENYTQIKDSLFNEEKVRSLQDIQTKYESEKQASEIKQLESDKKVQILETKKANTQKLALGIAFLFSIILVFISLWSYNQKKKSNISLSLKNEIITKQKEEVEQQKTIVEKAHYQLEEKNKEILDSINYAKRIQSAILPPQKIVKEYLKESFILYKPKDIVAGDFYWMENSGRISLFENSKINDSDTSKEDNLILFAAADCTGHGVPGAMVSVVCNNGLNRSVREHGITDPGEILNKTREIVIQEFEKSEEEVKDGMDISLCALNGNILKWAGANNPLWLIRKKNLLDCENELSSFLSISTDDYLLYEIKPDKQPIGKYAESKSFTTHTIELQSKDTIYIFTDGYSDQFGGEKGKKFKGAKFKELLINMQDKDMEQQKQIIDNTFEDWKGNLDQVDDVCVIGVRI